MTNESIIDKLDRKILDMLLKNARAPFLEIARECGVSGAAIHQRIQKLTKAGVITGSEFTVSPKMLGFHTCAYIGVFLENSSVYNSVVEAFSKIQEITQCHYTTGQYSVFIKVFAQDNEHLKLVLSDKIQSIEGVARTETFISLEEVFSRKLPV
jgi:Lrp/AsnC family transcriptional regulator for asnA, asnC and gidA